MPSEPSQQPPTDAWLEAIVRSAVDALVAVDPEGVVRLLNPAAERLLGWTAGEAVGALRLEAVLGEAGAAEAWRMLRDERFGGPGRLEPVRLEVRDRDGARLPVQLSGSLLHRPGGEPLGACFSLHDLRRREELERRLAEAQHKLAPSERQRLLAELRGTAAHELNQPLTSILAYATLLSRRIGEGQAERRAVERIRQEAERMADIVRKIGEMTRYQTKDYVGSQRILDLERGAQPPSEPPREGV